MISSATFSSESESESGNGSDISTVVSPKGQGMIANISKTLNIQTFPAK